MPARVPTSIPGIYAIERIETGRRYIGQARNIRKRWEIHRHYLNAGLHHNFVLQQAWTKYGKAAFTFIVLHDMGHIPSTELTAALNAAEIKAIQTADWPYNLGGGGDVRTPSEETRARTSRSAIASWSNGEFRQRHSDAIRARYADIEWKAARDAAVKAALSTPEHKARASRRFVQMWTDPQHHANQSAKRKANWADPEYRAKQSASRKAAWADPEVKRKRSAGLKAAWADPERHAKWACAVAEGNAAATPKHKERWANPEERRKQSERRKAYFARMKAAKPIEVPSSTWTPDDIIR